MRKAIPGGAGGMLRSRRNAANAKPNRVLDRSSSRGMIYENEELRLRTINISEEIEKGQNDIKKLRRENEQLRREIWALREECDRLQDLLKRQEEEGEESDEEDIDEFETIEDNVNVNKKSQEDGLSVVPEEPEDNLSNTSQQTTIEVKENNDRRMEHYKNLRYSCLRIYCVHPYTAVATLDPNFLRDLMITEVIEGAVEKTKGVIGVRLLTGSIYINCDSKESLEILISSGLMLRGIDIKLQDVSQGTIILAMTGVPHHLPDGDLAQSLSQFGPVIGCIERRLYRDVDTGERLARICLQTALPKRLFLQGSKIIIKPLTHDELEKLSNHPFQFNLAQLEFSSEVHSSPEMTSEPEPFFQRIPSTESTSSCQNGDRTQSAPNITVEPVTPNTKRRNVSDNEVKRSISRQRSRLSRRGRSPPTSSSEQESPTKPRRRRSSVFQGPIGFEKFDRDRSPSLSSKCSTRRKLSITGRETGKLPWCACWGNGCI